MSAFVVHPETIGRVLFVLAYPPRAAGVYEEPLPKEEIRKLGVDMMALNVRAVNDRYRQNEPPSIEPIQPVPCSFIQSLNSLQCWLYQCTEGDCDETPLYKRMRALSDEWAQIIVHRLPEYEKARWG